MDKLKYALIGCGRIAPNHVAAVLANNANVRLVGLCDLDIEKASTLLQLVPEKERSTIRIFANYETLLKDCEPDLVAVATESGNHASITIDAIEAGAHVIIEKPIALSLYDADKIISAANKHRRIVSACHQNRFNKSIQKIREAVVNGRFGRLFHGTAHIRWNRGPSYYEQASWRGTWEQDGGALMNQCIHNIDLLRWMMGDDIDEVYAYTDNLNHPYIEAEDIGVALVRFSNGSYGVIEGTTNVYPKNLEETLYLFGDKGTVKAGGKSVNKIEEWFFADGIDDPNEIISVYTEDPPNVYGFGHTPLYADVIEAIMNEQEPFVTALDGKRALELVLAIYESARTGLPVKLPLKNASTIDSRGRFHR